MWGPSYRISSAIQSRVAITIKTLEPSTVPCFRCGPALIEFNFQIFPQIHSMQIDEITALSKLLFPWEIAELARMNDRIVARAPFPNVDKTKGLVCDENADRFNVFYTDVCSMKA